MRITIKLADGSEQTLDVECIRTTVDGAPIELSLTGAPALLRIFSPGDDARWQRLVGHECGEFPVGEVGRPVAADPVEDLQSHHPRRLGPRIGGLGVVKGQPVQQRATPFPVAVSADRGDFGSMARAVSPNGATVSTN